MNGCPTGLLLAKATSVGLVDQRGTSSRGPGALCLNPEFIIHFAIVPLRLTDAIPHGDFGWGTKAWSAAEQSITRSMDQLHAKSISVRGYKETGSSQEGLSKGGCAKQSLSLGLPTFGQLHYSCLDLALPTWKPHVVQSQHTWRVCWILCRMASSIWAAS